MARAWKASLVRARQAQEDIARERLALAHEHARTSARLVETHDQRISAMLVERPASIAELIATAEGRARAAATLVDARHAQAAAHDQIAVRSVHVTAAAQARRSAEKMVERDAAAEAITSARSAQRELDELGSRRLRRTA